MKFTIVRKGKCKKCGYCCPKDCPHFEDNECLIYDYRAEYCDICGDTHQACIDAPPFPMYEGNPDCGYRFYIKEMPNLEIFKISCGNKRE